MGYTVQFTLKSRNAKLGAMPVSTTSANTCPDACPLKSQGCYAKYGPLGMMWSAVSQAAPGEAVKRATGIMKTLTWSSFCGVVAAREGLTMIDEDFDHVDPSELPQPKPAEDDPCT